MDELKPISHKEFNESMKGKRFKGRKDYTYKNIYITLKHIYFSFIQSHLNYGKINWGSAVPTIIAPTNILMKKAVRFMTFSEKGTHSPPLFKELDILNINDMIKQEWCKFIYDFHNNAIPLSLQPLFTYISDIHSYNT